VFNKARLDQARQRADESAASSSLAKAAEESYSSDPFEEVSASGSGDKVNNIWTRNKDQKKLATSSSDKYDDNDFESMSKSKSDTMMDSKKDSARSAKQGVKAKPVEKSILSTYVKKENKGTMTDAGKYDYMTAAESQPTTMKEWSLKRNLEDAEHLI
jgi:hypothetical protein